MGEFKPQLKNSPDWKNKPIYRILLTLATNEEFPQYGLHKLLHYDIGIINDYVIKLKKLDLLRVVRFEKSSRNWNIERFILKITFKGILIALSWQIIESDEGFLIPDILTVDKIATVHKKEWEIFQEWDSLNHDWFVFGPLISIRSYFSQSVYSDPDIMSKYIKKTTGYIYENYEDYYWKMWMSNSDQFINLTKEQRIELSNSMSHRIGTSNDRFKIIDTYYKHVANKIIFQLKEDLLSEDILVPYYNYINTIRDNPALKKLLLNEIELIEKHYVQLLEYKKYINS